MAAASMAAKMAVKYGGWREMAKACNGENGGGEALSAAAQYEKIVNRRRIIRNEWYRRKMPKNNGGRLWHGVAALDNTSKAAKLIRNENGGMYIEEKRRSVIENIGVISNQRNGVKCEISYRRRNSIEK
jgi:hypothetical protein